MPAAKTSQKALIALERANKAWEMRKVGATYEAIGKALGISAQAAYKAVKKYYDKAVVETTESAAEHKLLILHRMDAMLLAIYPKAKSGDLRAVAEVRALDKEKRAMLGLDEPTKTKTDVTSDGERLEGAAFVLPMPLNPDDWAAAAEKHKKE